MYGICRMKRNGTDRFWDTSEEISSASQWMRGIRRITRRNSTFTAGDSADLERALRSVMSDDFAPDSDAIAAEARRRFSSESHLEKLLPIYFPER